MADRDTKVLEMVERELKKDPKVSGAVLQEKARSINKEEAELGPRSFNARYPLPLRRKLSGRIGGRKKAAKKKAAPRRRAAGAPRSSGSLQDLLVSHLQSKGDVLVAALDAAQSRAVQSGDLAVIEAFGKKMDRMIKSLGAE
jgi:hypothetical protein